MADGTTTPAASAAPAAPTTPAAPAAPAAATPAAPAAPNANPSWLGDGTPEDVRGYTELKGWKSGKDAVESYRNLEKLLGADRAGRTVVIPGENAQAAEVEAFHAKLGRPVEAKDYKITVPEGSNTEFADTAKSWFHEAGLTQKQADVVAKHWNEYANGVMSADTQASAQKVQVEQQQLRSEWGAAYEPNIQLAAQARNKLGISNEEVDSLANVIGFKRTIQMFHDIGKRGGEADFVNGSHGNGFQGAMTPAQATARIQQLRGDPEWTKAYIKGDVSKRDEMWRLSQLAAGQAPK